MRWNILRLIIAFYILAALYGGRRAIFEYDQRIDMLLHFGMHFTAALACIRDSRARNRPIIISLHWLLLAFFPLSVILYLVDSRRWRGLLIGLLHAVLFLAVSGGANLATGLLLHGSEWPAGASP